MGKARMSGKAFSMDLVRQIFSFVFCPCRTYNDHFLLTNFSISIHPWCDTSREMLRMHETSLALVNKVLQIWLAQKWI